MDIETRRASGRAAVKAYMQSHPDHRRSKEITEEAVIDLIADVLHLCRTADIDIDGVLRMAATHVEVEHKPTMHCKECDRTYETTSYPDHVTEDRELLRSIGCPHCGSKNVREERRTVTMEYKPVGQIRQSGKGRSGRLITLEEDEPGKYSVRAYKVVAQDVTQEPMDREAAREIFDKLTKGRKKT